ncbi:MAG: hypothetical protein QN229_05885 [Desulfurococcaceae archaeon TW002]
MEIRSARTAKQKIISGLLVFTLLIIISLALGFYGYYIERTPKTTINTTPTITPTTPINTTPTITTPTNTTVEVPYTPE